MDGAGDKRGNGKAWGTAVLLGWLLFSGRLLAQTPATPLISFSEEPPARAPVFHSTQCYFPASPLNAREPGGVAAPVLAPSPNPAATPEAVRQAADILQASCSSCGSGLPMGALGSYGGCGGCGGCAGPPPTACLGCGCVRPGCVPGRIPFCQGCEPHPPSDNCIHKFFHCIHECLCCPDPCYEGKWHPLADTAFYAASARPMTQQRIRWNAGINVMLPDRAEYLWARADGLGKGPKAPPFGGFVVNNFNYHDFFYYFEASIGKFSVITQMSYRSQDLTFGAPHYAGFGDMMVGTKSLIFDCELLQVAFQFLTYLPTGAPNKGLGVGHVSLEPSLLLGIRVGPDTFYQGQLSEWIPLGGDPLYAGAVAHTHHSLNQVLWRFRPDVLLIGAAELNTWYFQDGAFTDPLFGPYQSASGVTYATMGPGVRLFICDRIDFGFAASFALNQPNFHQTMYTSEFRWRF